MEEDQNSGQTTYSSQLPVSKIKKIAKLHPDTNLLSAEATQIIAIACEKFIGLMAEEAYHQAQSEKRKTVQMRDIDYCIRNTAWLEFLDGALDGWPEFSSKSKTTGAVSVDETEREDQTADDTQEASDGEEEEVVEEADESQTDHVDETQRHSKESEAETLPETEDFDQLTSLSLRLPESENSLMDVS